MASVGGLRQCRDGGIDSFGRKAVEFVQRQREPTRFAGDRGGEHVGGLLALVTDALREPPHHWMVEQQRFRGALQEIGQIVVTADMRELVREQRFQHLHGHARQQRCRHQHHRSPEAGGQRPAGIVEHCEAYTRQAEPLCQTVEACLPHLIFDIVLDIKGIALQAMHPAQTAGQAQQHQTGACGPGRDQPRQGRFEYRTQVRRAIGGDEGCEHRRDVARWRHGRGHVESRRRRHRQLSQHFRGRPQHAGGQRCAGDDIAGLRRRLTQRAQRQPCQRADQRALP